MNKRTLFTSMTVFLAVLFQVNFSHAVLLKQTAGTEVFEKKTLLACLVHSGTPPIDNAADGQIGKNLKIAGGKTRG